MQIKIKMKKIKIKTKIKIRIKKDFPVFCSSVRFRIDMEKKCLERLSILLSYLKLSWSLIKNLKDP